MKNYKSFYVLFQEVGLSSYKGILYSSLDANSKRDVKYIVMSLKKLSRMLDEYLYVTNLHFAIKGLSNMQEEIDRYIRVLSSSNSFVVNTRTIESFIYSLLSCFDRLQSFSFNMHRMGY